MTAGTTYFNLFAHPIDFIGLAVDDYSGKLTLMHFLNLFCLGNAKLLYRPKSDQCNFQIFFF